MKVRKAKKQYLSRMWVCKFRFWTSLDTSEEPSITYTRVFSKSYPGSK